MGSIITTADIAEPRRFAFWQEAVCDTFVQLDCTRTSERPFAGEISTARTEWMNFSRVRSRDHRVERTPQRIRRAREETVLVSLLLSGKATIAQDGREAILAPGDFAFYDSTRPYLLSMEGDFEQLVLHMPRRELLRWVGNTERLTARAISGGSVAGGVVAPFLQNVAASIGSMDRALAERFAEISLSLVTVAAGELFGEPTARQSQGRTALVYRAKSLIQADLGRPDLNTDLVARALGISPRYLQDLFYREGTTVSDWIWTRRLEKARRALLDPLLAGESISQVALACGFQDLAHFSRRFRLAYGRSPRDYRRTGIEGQSQGP